MLLKCLRSAGCNLQVPISGGGMTSGIALAAKHIAPNCRSHPLHHGSKSNHSKLGFYPIDLCNCPGSLTEPTSGSVRLPLPDRFSMCKTFQESNHGTTFPLLAAKCDMRLQGGGGWANWQGAAALPAEQRKTVSKFSYSRLVINFIDFGSCIELQWVASCQS